MSPVERFDSKKYTQEDVRNAVFEVCAGQGISGEHTLKARRVTQTVLVVGEPFNEYAVVLVQDENWRKRPLDDIGMPRKADILIAPRKIISRVNRRLDQGYKSA